MQVLLPGEDVKFSSPADVGGGYEAFQYRTLLAVSASLGLSDLPNKATSRSNLGLGSIATQAANNVAITGGSINGITLDGGTF